MTNTDLSYTRRDYFDFALALFAAAYAIVSAAQSDWDDVILWFVIASLFASSGVDGPYVRLAMRNHHKWGAR